MDVVKEGYYVALMKSFDSGNMKIVPALKDTMVHYGKFHFDTAPLIGCKFGSVFEIKDGTMVEIKDFDDFDNHLSSLVSNNMINFNDKSQFSKEKMIKKKKKSNHSNVVTVIRPNLLLINEMFYGREKIGGLRPDLLSQIITAANLQNGIRCFLSDHNLGIVTGAVMSRILPDGVCIQLVQDNEVTTTTRKTINMLNISEKCEDHLFAVTMKDFHKICKGKVDFEGENEILRARSREILVEQNTRCLRNSETNTKEKVLDDAEISQTLIKKDANRELRNRERVMAASHLQTHLMDSMIFIVQNDHPLPLLKSSFKFLTASGQFVIYSDTVQPLLDCYHYLKSNSLAVSLNLSDSWLRKYQVLPDRTRPEMSTTGFGGYLLFGTKKFLVAEGNLNSIPSSSGDIEI